MRNRGVTDFIFLLLIGVNRDFFMNECKEIN